MYQDAFAVFSSCSVVVLVFKGSSLIYSELIFFQGERYGSRFIFLQVEIHFASTIC